MKTSMKLWLIWLICLLLIPAVAGVNGCHSGKLPEIVDVRDLLFVGGAPHIDKVTDLGLPAIPRSRRLEGVASDGLAAIGELMLIQGGGFTRQPRVEIGGRAAEVQARVAGGGILVKVPWGIDPGEVKFTVSHEGGRHSVTYPVRRRGLVLHSKGVDVVEVHADGKVTNKKSRVLLNDGQQMVFSWDGAVAYIAGGKGEVWLWVLDMTGPEPKIVERHSFPGERLVALATAEQAKFGVLVTDTHIVYIDCYRAAAPAYYTPRRIPREIAGKNILAAALSGQGKTLALLLADLNQVAVIDATQPKVLPTAEVVELLPDARLQVVSDLLFSTDGGSIWVVSSDTTRSIHGGYQPTQLTLLQVTMAPDRQSSREVKVHQTWELGEKAAAVELALARGEPIPPGTAIRAEPSTSSVYIAELPSELIKAGDALMQGPWQGQVIRSSLDKKKAEPVAEGPWLSTSLDVVGSTQVLVALGVQQRSGKYQRVLIHKKAWRGGPPQILELSEIDPSELKQSAPPWLGIVRVQP